MDRRTALKWMSGAWLAGTGMSPRPIRGRMTGSYIEAPDVASASRRLSRRDRGEAQWLDVAISPDGALVAAGGTDFTWPRDYSPWLWNAESGREAGPLPGSIADVLAVAFGPEAARVAAGGVARLKKLDRGISVATIWDGGAVRVWDVRTRRELYALTEFERPVTAVAIGPRYIATIDLNSVFRRFEVADGRSVLELADLAIEEQWGTLPPDQRVSFSADATRAVAIGRSGGEGRDDRRGERSLKLWETSAGRARRLRDQSTRCVALSPDGTQFATAVDRTLLLNDFETLDFFVFKDMLRSRSIWLLVFSPDGRRLISGDEDGVIQIWDVDERREVRWFQGPKTHARAVAVLPGGGLRFVSGGFRARDERTAKFGVLKRDPLVVWDAPPE